MPLIESTKIIELMDIVYSIYLICQINYFNILFFYGLLLSIADPLANL